MTFVEMCFLFFIVNFDIVNTKHLNIYITILHHLQLFSRSTSIGLKVYREAGIEGLRDSSGTEIFTKMTNDLFDSLNARHPREGITKNSPRIQA